MAYFDCVEKVNFEGKDSKNALAFKYYNPDEVIAGKPMREHLKFALSWWHTMCGDGTDMFGVGTADKTWDGHDDWSIANGKVEAAFELMQKLSIDYFCFHDRDIAPEGNSLSETNKMLDQIAEVIEAKQKETGIKCL